MAFHRSDAPTASLAGRHGLFQSLPDKPLVRNSALLGALFQGIEQGLRKAHIDPRALFLELEPDRLRAGKVVVGKIGGITGPRRNFRRARVCARLREDRVR